MKIYKEGEKSKALCEKCEGLVKTTFEVRNVPFSSGKGRAKDVLVGVCDKCDSVVSIPQQSVPRVKEQREKLYKPIEARIPRHFYDMLRFSYSKLGIHGTEEVAPIVKYYTLNLNILSERAKLKKIKNSDLFKGKSSERVSMKLSESIYNEFVGIKNKLGISNTELIKTFIIQFYEDVESNKASSRVKKLKQVLRVAS